MLAYKFHGGKDFYWCCLQLDFQSKRCLCFSTCENMHTHVCILGVDVYDLRTTFLKNKCLKKCKGTTIWNHRKTRQKMFASPIILPSTGNHLITCIYIYFYKRSLQRDICIISCLPFLNSYKSVGTCQNLELKVKKILTIPFWFNSANK